MIRDTFVLDSNVFIEAYRRYYAFDIAPGFWASLIVHSGNGKVCSVDRVLQEIQKGKDDLRDWVTNSYSGAFCSTDESEVIEKITDIIRWIVGNNQYKNANKNDYLSGADGWLVAYAAAKRATLVTQEVVDFQTKRKIPLPNVCKEFQVPYMNTFEMLRKLRVVFN